MDPLDRIQQNQSRQVNRDLTEAEHDLNWSESFNSVPPADVLRSRVNYADAIDRAYSNKINLAAQSDMGALRLLQNQQKFKEWQTQAPLREELLRRRVESQGAHERFIQQKDSEAMADLSGFLEATRSIKSRPGTPEYAEALSTALQTHPRVIGTQVGSDTLKRLQQEHEDISAINPPPGHRVARYEFSSDGRIKAVTEPIPATTATPEGLVPVGATQDKDGNMQVRYGQAKEATDASTQRELSMYQSAMDRASDRRIRAQKAFDAAKLVYTKNVNKENKDIYDSNLDLVKAADADILEAKAAIKALQGNANPAAPLPATTAPAIPTPGEVRNGWKFKGGDPADRSNWER